jgi:hypothetical protein
MQRDRGRVRSDTRESESSVAASARPTSPAPRTQAVLNLQRGAGNRAAGALISQRRARTLQRLDTGEHAQVGSDEIVHVNGVEFTRKQLTTMGDFYATADDMMKAPQDELLKLKADIEKQTKHYKGEPGGEDTSQGQWEKDTSTREPGHRYLDLAAKNDTHFGPGQFSGGLDHKTTWEENHRRALWEVRMAARNAPLSSVAVPERAKLINDFGSHFLTDAFAAGHLIAKADMMHAAQESFEGLDHTRGMFTAFENLFTHLYTNDFTDEVSRIIMNNAGARKKLDQYELKFIIYREIDEERFSELLYQLPSKEHDLFYSAFVKAIHDPLNESIVRQPGKPVAPVVVTNQRGDGPWELPGDTTLAQSPQTLEIMNAAVAQADANLQDVTSLPLPPPNDPLDFGFETQIPHYLKLVWDYTPQPTLVGLMNMDEIFKEGTDTRSGITAQRFAEVGMDNLDIVITKLIEKGYMKSKAELAKERAAAGRAVAEHGVMFEP